MTLIVIDQCIWKFFIECLQMRNKCLHIIMLNQTFIVSRIQSILFSQIIWRIITEQTV